MNWRKNPEVNIDKQRFMFVALGLIMAGSIGLLAFEWRTYSTTVRQIVSDIVDEEIEEEIFEIQMNAPPPPPPPPPSTITEVVEIVENNAVIENELEVNADVDENTTVNTNTIFGDGPPTDEPVEDNTVYDPNVIQDLPVWPGCEDVAASERFTCMQEKIQEFVSKNFVYPSDAKEIGKTGRVVVRFVLEKDGSISNVEVPRSVYESLDDEGIRVIKKLGETYKGQIQPAKQAGKNVRVYLAAPILCRLN